MRPDASLCAVTMMASKTSVPGTTSSDTGLPSFSATDTTAVNNSCS
jgi:hypothetical protein